MNAPSSNNPELTAQLNAIIRSKGVGVVFQPIIDLNDGMIIAFEALTRPRPESGFTAADKLFQCAEGAGLLWELEEVTREAAIQAAAKWPRDVRLFFNTSPEVFADSRFTDVLMNELSTMPGLTPDRIVLEITELAQTAEDNTLLSQVQTAKARGFQVAVDDAGAGTSGLNRMMILRPQWIKMDRNIVREIQTDQFRQNLVRFFVHFARLSGVNVLAEGIETAPELATLIGLGVRFGQGYFLGRPESRATTSDPQFAAQVRERWASVEAHVPQIPKEMPLVRLCQSVTALAPSTSVTDAAKALQRDPKSMGVVTVDGRCLLGWLGRDSVIRLAAEGLPAMLAQLTRAILCPLPPTATVDEALQMVCLREDHDLGEPLIVASGAEVVGALRLRDLIRTAVREERSGSSLRAPLTGLPARVRADQHIDEMLSRAADPIVRQSHVFHPDAAFVDIRRFADFNGVHGYEAGDRLIRDLGDRIRATFGEGESGVFIAHLGDDRFLLTAPQGLLAQRVEELVEGFEQVVLKDREVAGRIGSDAGVPAARNSMGLRVLMLPGIFERAQHMRDVYRAEQLLRQRARLQESHLAPGRSLVLSDSRIDLRLSA